MLKRLLLPVAATLALFVAAPAQANTFNIDQVTVSLHDSGPGLLVNSDALSILPFDLDSVGQSVTRGLFTIGTDETALNLDDLIPDPISVAIHFSLPLPGYQTNGPDGITGAAWFLQSFGYVVWDNPLQLAFGNTGLLAISLSDAVFGLPGSSQVNATFTLLRADSGSAPIPTPEPSSLALLGLGLAGLAAARRKRRAA
jgi:hypothetical protein